METYRVWFTMEGFVDVEAESEEDARYEFSELSDNELLNNVVGGATVDDIRVQ